jgi:23S rRNA pseudouridine955/2504/2580 synthase
MVEDKLVEDKVVYFHVSNNEIGTRIDKWLLTNFTHINNSVVQKMIRTGQIRINGKKVNFKEILEAEQIIRVPIAYINSLEKIKTPKKVFTLDLCNHQSEIDIVVNNILYKDDNFLVINKPFGMAVQGGSNIGFNLTSMLSKLRFGNKDNPMLVHRIDKDTSGCLILARNISSANYMLDQFKNKKINKIYHCLAYPFVDLESGVIDAPLLKTGVSPNQKMVVHEDGKLSITNYRVLEIKNKIGLLEINPITGRTHQIRVHLSYCLKTPILGDFKYNFASIPSIDTKRLYLHASKIDFLDINSKQITVECRLEENFLQMMKNLDFNMYQGSLS